MIAVNVTINVKFAEKASNICPNHVNVQRCNRTDFSTLNKLFLQIFLKNHIPVFNVYVNTSIAKC